MPHVSLGYACASSTRWPHRSNKLDVDELAECILLAVVPSSVVHPLSKDFDGRLSAIRLLGGHVQVVHEDDTCHPQRRA